MGCCFDNVGYLHDFLWIGKWILLRHSLLRFLNNHLWIYFINKSVLHLGHWDMWRWNRTVMSLNLMFWSQSVTYTLGRNLKINVRLVLITWYVPFICSAWVQKYRGDSLPCVLLAQSWISEIPFLPVHCTCKVLIQPPPLPGIAEGSQPASGVGTEWKMGL